MSFDPEARKQAQETIFRRKYKRKTTLLCIFTKIPPCNVFVFFWILEHLKNIFAMAKEKVGPSRNFQNFYL